MRSGSVRYHDSSDSFMRALRDYKPGTLFMKIRAKTHGGRNHIRIKAAGPNGENIPHRFRYHGRGGREGLSALDVLWKMEKKGWNSRHLGSWFGMNFKTPPTPKGRWKGEMTPGPTSPYVSWAKNGSAAACRHMAMVGVLVFSAPVIAGDSHDRPFIAEHVPMSDWGMDHWSTFAYIETRIVDYRGSPEITRMRTDRDLHPGLAHGSMGWKKYPTRLKRIDGETREIAGHDDWSCLEDAEREGLLEWAGTGIDPIFVLTDRGRKVSDELRAWKRAGGKFSNFKPSGQ